MKVHCHTVPLILEIVQTQGNYSNYLSKGCDHEVGEALYISLQLLQFYLSLHLPTGSVAPCPTPCE
jgi:hypothetical protein